uniref:Putative secreted protein n=1 Tax=Triatoma infestans TaxID=30076 RepID=A0A023FB21_TRIIF
MENFTIYLLLYFYFFPLLQTSIKILLWCFKHYCTYERLSIISLPCTKYLKNIKRYYDNGIIFSLSFRFHI